MIKPVLSGDGAGRAHDARAERHRAAAPTDVRRQRRTRRTTSSSSPTTPRTSTRVRTILKEVDRRPQQILHRGHHPPRRAERGQRAGRRLQRPRRRRLHRSLDQRPARPDHRLPTCARRPLAPQPTQHTVHSVGTGNVVHQRRRRRPEGRLRVATTSPSSSRALEGVTDTTVLANPKVLALNKQKGEVIVGRKDGYLTTTPPRRRHSADGRVPRDRYAADLPPVHRRRRLHPHGNPPGRLRRPERPTACRSRSRPRSPATSWSRTATRS